MTHFSRVLQFWRMLAIAVAFSGTAAFANSPVGGTISYTDWNDGGTVKSSNLDAGSTVSLGAT
jgi:hypothetical protein